MGCVIIGGIIPHLPPYASIEDKKKTISDFIKKEKGIKMVKIAKELLKGQFLAAIDKDYVIKHKEDMREIDAVPLRTLLQHVKDKYIKIYDTLCQDHEQL